MGIFSVFFLGEFDKEICSAIAKEYKYDLQLVEKEYSKMIERIKLEIEK